jgi:hypothetical protein
MRPPITGKSRLRPPPHPFEFLPPTRAQKIGRAGIHRQRVQQARADAARKRTNARRAYAADRGSIEAQKRVASSAQVYPSRITPPPRTRLTKREQRLNKGLKRAGVSDMNLASQFAAPAIRTALGIPFIPYHVAHALFQDVRSAARAQGRKGPPVGASLYRDVLKPVGVSVKQTIQDPTRDPWNTALNATMVLGGVSGLAGRMAAVSQVLREGETLGGRGLLKAATLTPVPKPRPIKGSLPSRNYLVNKALIAHDKRTLGRVGHRPTSLDVGGLRSRAQVPIEKAVSAETKIGRAHQRHREIIQRKDYGPVVQLDKYGQTTTAHMLRRKGRGTILPKFGRAHLSAAELKAGDIRASGLTPAEHAAAHLRTAQRIKADPELAHIFGSATDHEAQAALARLAEPHYNNPSRHLHDATNLMRRVSTKTAKWLGIDQQTQVARIGARTAELKAMASGEDSPLQLRDQHEATLGKLTQGVSPKLIEKHGIAGALRLKVDKFNRQDVERAIRSGEAEVAKLQAQLGQERARGQAAPSVEAEVANRAAGAASRKRAQLDRQITQKQAKLDRLQRRHLDLQTRPRGTGSADLTRSAQSVTAVERELKALKAEQRTAKREATAIAERQQVHRPPIVAAKNQVTDAIEASIRKTEGELTRLRKQAGERLPSEQASLTWGQLQHLERELYREGQRVIQKGGFFVSGKPYRSLREIGRRPFAGASAPGPAGIPKPQVPKQKRYTGSSTRQGLNRSDVTNAVADEARSALSVRQRVQAHGFALQHAKDTEAEAGGAEFAIPVRETTGIPHELRAVIAKPHPGPMTANEMHELDDHLLKHLYPAKGSEGHDIKYVDARLLGRMAGARGGKAAAAIDTLNSAARASILWGQGPKYIVNLLQNIATATSRQGIFVPFNAHLLREAEKKYPGDAALTTATIGGGRSMALAPERGLGAHVLQRTAHFWNSVTDQPIRDLALVHEARTLGFNTVDKYHDFLHNHPDQLVEAAQRADYESVPFNNMTPFEQDVVKRFIIFYPWLRGASIYAARFPIEHPIQAGVGSTLAQEGYRKYAAKGMPSDYQGSFTIPKGVPVLGGWTYDPRSVNTFSTPVDLTQAAAGLTQEYTAYADKAIQNMSPTLGFFGELAFGKNALGFGPRPGQSRLGFALQNQMSAIPLSQPFTKYNKQGGLIKGGLEAAGRSAGLGRLGGFQYDPAKMTKIKQTEVLAGKSATERINYKRDQALSQLRKVAPTFGPQAKRLLPAVAKAIRLDHARESALRAKAKQLNRKPNELSQAQQLQIEIGVLKNFGLFPKRYKAKDVLERAWGARDTTGVEHVRKARLLLWEEAMPQVGGRSLLNLWKEALKEKGIDYLGNG